MAVDPSQSGHCIAYARGNVVIAWKAGRETTRAVFDALSLLEGVENVHILEVKGRADETTVGDDTSIAASLARHGVKPTIRTSVTRPSRVSPIWMQTCW
jgi:hypothetical protein